MVGFDKSNILGENPTINLNVFDFDKSNILGGNPRHMHHESKMVDFDKSTILGGNPLHMNRLSLESQKFAPFTLTA